MENISLGQIVAFISLISIIIGAITSLIAFSKNFISKVLKPLNEKINHLEKVSTENRNNIERELIKIILVNFIDDIEKGENKTSIQKQNIYELYDRYIALGGNSYVHDNWQRLIKEGKI